MLITKNFDHELAELSVEGALDNESSVHFRNEIESCTRDGWHRILVDLSGVHYISSAGIGALIASRQQLKKLNGFFGICHPTAEVKAILQQVRLFDSLACDPQEIRDVRSAGSMTISLSESTRFASDEGIDMEIYPLEEADPIIWRIIGSDSSLTSTQQPHPVEFRPGQFGIGLGSLGASAGGETSPCGELLAVDGGVAQSPLVNGALPDYSVATGEFHPVVQMISGIHCAGTLPTLIRFEPSEHGRHVALSSLINQALQQIEATAGAFVILADCAGLVGAQLLRTPDDIAADKHFQVPEIRRWLSFSADPLYRRNLVLITGVAIRGKVKDQSPLQAFTRPMNSSGTVRGHFHAGVFPYEPLKKRTLKLHQSVRTLFEKGSIEDVLHLLNDDRPISGSGETELLSGACWVGALNESPDEESRG